MEKYIYYSIQPVYNYMGSIVYAAYAGMTLKKPANYISCSYNWGHAKKRKETILLIDGAVRNFKKKKETFTHRLVISINYCSVPY